MTRFNFEFKLKVIQNYLHGTSAPTLAKRFGIKNDGQILNWVHRYRKYGIDGVKARQFHIFGNVVPMP